MIGFGTYDDMIDTAEGVLSQGGYVCGGHFTRHSPDGPRFVRRR